VGEHLPGRAGRRHALEEVLRTARTVVPPDVPAEELVVSGEPGPALVAQSREAAVVVIGDRGAGRLEAVLTGSVAAVLVAGAECPVVVVRGEVAAGSPVVVGVDGTPAAGVAAAFALREAAARGVPLVAVHAADQRARIAQRLQVLGRGHPDVPVRVVVTGGAPGESLLAESRRAQLVVVGSRGFGEFAGLARGSVSALLVHRAACPVAVVGPGVASGGWSDAVEVGNRLPSY
jgi:nucleotide-binding universal stress UspA family protein